MSYSIGIFKAEVERVCKENSYKIGELLENKNHLIAKFDVSDLLFLEKYFSSPAYIGNWNLILKTENMNVYDCRNEVTATVYENYVSLNTRFLNSWELLMISSDIQLESNFKLKRFDFQDGNWG